MAGALQAAQKSLYALCLLACLLILCATGVTPVLEKGTGGAMLLWRDMDWVPEPPLGWLGLSQAPL